MGNKHQNGKKEAATDQPADPRLAYLHRIGLTGKTPDDLIPPDLEHFAQPGSNDFDLIGADVHAGFEYYRAVDDNSVSKAEMKGYFSLPAGTDVKYRGCNTPTEIMMARTIEQGDAYRKAEYSRREALRSGKAATSSPMSGGVVINETTERSRLAVNTQER